MSDKEVPDLMEALAQSLAEARGRRRSTVLYSVEPEDCSTCVGVADHLVLGDECPECGASSPATEVES